MIPHITIEQAKAFCGVNDAARIAAIFNQGIDAANAEQEQYITAEEARKLGAGKAEWCGASGTWFECYTECAYNKVIDGASVKYRAIKQEPTSADYAQGYVEGFNDACKPKPWKGSREDVLALLAEFKII